MSWTHYTGLTTRAHHEAYNKQLNTRSLLDKALLRECRSAVRHHRAHIYSRDTSSLRKLIYPPTLLWREDLTRELQKVHPA